MLLQRIIVSVCTCALYLYNKVHRRKWMIIAVVCVYLMVRWWNPMPGITAPRRVHINKVITVFPAEDMDVRPSAITSAWTNETFECVGWKRLHSCPPEARYDDDGELIPFTPDELATDEPEEPFLRCNESIRPRMAGYCVVRNRTSSDVFHTMVTACNSLPLGDFKCENADEFMNYGYHSVNYQHFPTAPTLAAKPNGEDINPINGILMVVYDRVLPSAYATIRLLRHHGCVLPIEIWYRPDEMSIDNSILHRLLEAYDVRLRPIMDARATGFHVKPYAVYYSHLDNILLLDADNLPVRDPTYLFEDPVFRETGAIFWPDFWQPTNSLFKVTNVSLLWELTGVQYANMFEQESGQVLINRRKSKPALEKLMYYSTHQPRLLETLHQIWGDKDLFRLAWMNASQPFHYIRFPPAVGGLDLRATKGVFCGLSMIQHDAQGNVIFFHRNSVKLDGTRNQPRILTHIQEYALQADPTQYQIYQAVHAYKDCCYYIGTNTTLADGQPVTAVTPIEATSFADLEDLAIAFSIEGRDLLKRSSSSSGQEQDQASAETPSLTIREIVAIFLLAYVFFIICFVWCKARPMRERLPSRWRPMESKER